MKKLHFAIGLTILMLAIGFIWQQRNNPTPPPSKQAGILETQTNNEGAVVIAITPKDIAKGIFEIALDTHSVELSDDLAQASVSVLKNENGKEYKPLSWEGDPPGGHHREGILKFGPLSPTPKKIELIISGIGGIPERKFLWIILP